MTYETLENGVLSLKETTPCPKCGYETRNTQNYVFLQIDEQPNQEVQKMFSKVNGKYCMGCFALFISQNVTKVE